MLRPAIKRRVEAGRLHHRRRIHHPLHRLCVLKIRRRNSDARQIQLRILRMKRSHPLRVLHTRRMQQHRLDHTEDRRIRTNAQSQRQNRHNRERRRTKKLPHRIAQIFNQSHTLLFSAHTQQQCTLFAKTNALKSLGVNQENPKSPNLLFTFETGRSFADTC